jgi:hypothetical protein
MRRLVLILLTLIAVVTFIRAFDEAVNIDRVRATDSGLADGQKTAGEEYGL